MEKGSYREFESLFLLRGSNVTLPSGCVRRGKGAKQRMATYDSFASGYLDAWIAVRQQLGATGRQPLFCSVSSGETRRPGAPSASSRTPSEAGPRVMHSRTSPRCSHIFSAAKRFKAVNAISRVARSTACCAVEPLLGIERAIAETIARLVPACRRKRHRRVTGIFANAALLRLKIRGDPPDPNGSTHTLFSRLPRTTHRRHRRNRSIPAKTRTRPSRSFCFS